MDETNPPPEHLAPYGISTESEYAEAAFARNIGLLTPAEQETLGSSRAAIAGLGGVGGLHLVSLVRSGIGRFSLADFDRFEPANVNRQYGARLPDFGRPKLETMIREARSINPFLDIAAFPEGISRENLDVFLDGADVVLDGLDFFEFDLRRAMFNRARERGIPVVTAGPLGFSCALLVFTPDGMGFDEYFDVRPELPAEDNYLRFAMGLAPRATHIRYMDLGRVDLSNRSGPSLGAACQLCAALATTESLRLLLKRPGVRPAPHYLQFDPYLRALRRGSLRFGNRHPLQRLKLWYVKRFLLSKKR